MRHATSHQGPAHIALGPDVAPHIRTGMAGEGIATRFARSIGLYVLARNVRVSKDEIDIVAWDAKDNVITFIEVKTRAHSSEDFHGFLNMTPHKKMALARAARAWVAEHSWGEGYRIDLICVSNNEVTDYIQECPWFTSVDQ